MSGLDFLRAAKEAEDVQKEKPLPNNLDEAIESVKEYINGQLPVTYEMDFIPVCFDVTQNEEKVFIGGRHGNIAIFSVTSKRMTKDIELSSTAITSVHLACDDSLGIVVTENNVIYFLEFPSFYLKRTLSYSGSLISLKTTYLKDSLYFTNRTDVLFFIELEKITERKISLENQANCIDISDDGTLIALGLENGSIIFLHGETERMLQITEACTSAVDIVAFSQHRKWIAAGYQDFSVIIYNIDDKTSIRRILNVHEATIKGLIFVYKSRYLISGGTDNKIMVLDLKVDASPYFLDLFDAPVLTFRPSPDFKKLYFSQENNNLNVWKIPNLPKASRLRKHSMNVNAILIIPGGFELLSLGDDGLVVLWDYKGSLEQEHVKFDSRIITGVMSKTGVFALLSSSKPGLIRLSLSTYKFYEYSLTSTVISMCMNESETLLAMGDELFRILIYDAVIMERSFVIKGHTGLVTGLRFINNDNWVISCSEDTSLVKWDVKGCTKIVTLQGHENAVKCITISQDERWAISGSSDNVILIWSLDYDVVLHTINQAPHSSGILSIFLSSDKSYMVVLQECGITFWQMSNLNVIYQQTSQFPAHALGFNEDETVVTVAEGDTIYVEDNCLLSEKIRVVGKRYGSEHKFMNYVRNIIEGPGRNLHNESYNHWVFMPYRLGLAHILSYSNKNTTLEYVLTRTENKATFCTTINDENPISISVNMDHGSCIDVCLKFIKMEYLAGNTRAYIPLANCLTELTKLDISSIPKIYDIIYQQSDALHLPSFSVEGITTLPSLYKSREILINIEELLPKDLRATHGESVVFFGSLCPLNLELGSQSSIDFLESLTECNYSEIFRSRLLIEILKHKWDHVKLAINLQGSLYILYLIQLSFYCIFLRDSDLFLGSLFFVHVLLFLYEVMQIATDFVDYWFDMWNIMDQLRGLSFTIYVILKWRGIYNANILLTVIIFSWTRGISYFRMFDGTRYMVRLLSEVINDMQVFFVILSYSTLAFTFILYLNEGEMLFGEYLTVSYRLDLADFNTEGFKPFDWIIFFFATVINPLVMMNLLISIMGSTYERVKEGNDIANLQELTEMILEIEKLMFWKKKLNRQHFLQQCIPLLDIEEPEQDKVNERLKFMKNKIESLETTLNELVGEFPSDCIDQIISEVAVTAEKSTSCTLNLESSQKNLEESHQILEKIMQVLDN